MPCFKLRSPNWAKTQGEERAPRTVAVAVRPPQVEGWAVPATTTSHASRTG